MAMDLQAFEDSFAKIWGYTNCVQLGAPHLAEDGCIVKTAGVDESIWTFAGPARIFESQEEACAAILADEIEPGDVIVTGTPGGVGAARNPPVFMDEGDVIEVEVSPIGVLRQTVVVG